MVSWLVADRGLSAATTFLQDVSERLSNRGQLTTDGHKAYLSAVDGVFNEHIDYAMLVMDAVFNRILMGLYPHNSPTGHSSATHPLIRSPGSIFLSLTATSNISAVDISRAIGKLVIHTRWTPTAGFSRQLVIRAHRYTKSWVFDRAICAVTDVWSALKLVIRVKDRADSTVRA